MEPVAERLCMEHDCSDILWLGKQEKLQSHLHNAGLEQEHVSLVSLGRTCTLQIYLQRHLVLGGCLEGHHPIVWLSECISTTGVDGVHIGILNSTAILLTE